MTPINETLRPADIFHVRDGERNTLASGSLSHARIDHIFAQRTEMLSSIKKDIGSALYDALSAKIQYESDALRAIIASLTKNIVARKKLNKTLPSTYFIQKPLDKNIL